MSGDLKDSLSTTSGGDWELISSDDHLFAAHFKGSKDDLSKNGSKTEKMLQRVERIVVVEMPPGGIVSSHQDLLVSGQESGNGNKAAVGTLNSSLKRERDQASDCLTASSVMRRKFSAVDIAATASSFSLAGPSMTSEVHPGVSSSNRLAQEDDDSSVSFLSHFTTPRTINQWKEGSLKAGNASTLLAYANTDENSTLGSIVDDFEIICSTSGDTVKSCMRCKFHNPHTATICQCCYLALVANPSPDVDKQIAFNLQRKEEGEALRVLQEEREKERVGIQHDFSFDQATFLTYQIRDLVLGTDELELQRKEYHLLASRAGFLKFKGLHCLLEHDLKLLGAHFIKMLYDFPLDEISLAYKYTWAESWNDIRLNGFNVAIADDGAKGITVAKNVQAGLEIFQSSEEGSRNAPKTMFPLSETEPAEDALAIHGWIVLVATSLTNNQMAEDHSDTHQLKCNIKDQLKCKHALPLVFFDSSQDEGKIHSLFEKLSGLCMRFFGLRFNNA